MNNSYYQISYPRSGSHLVRNLSRHILKFNKLPIHFEDQPRSPYIRSHYLPKDTDYNRKLIVILRHPVEVIVRHNDLSREDIINKKFIKHLSTKSYTRKDKTKPGKYKTDEDWGYMTHLTTYDEWPSEKLLLYYEDLILNPIKQVIRLGNFIGNRFKIDECRRVIKNTLYNYNNEEGSETKGKSTTQHIDKVGKDCIPIIMGWIKRWYSYYYNTYLKRYYYE